MKKWIKSNRRGIIIAWILAGILLVAITVTLQHKNISQSQDVNVYLQTTDKRLQQIVSSFNLVTTNPENMDLITNEFSKIEENFIRLDQNLLLFRNNIKGGSYSEIFMEMSNNTKSVYLTNDENIELNKEDIESLQQKVDTLKEFRDLINDLENNNGTSITPESFTDLINDFEDILYQK